MWKTKEQIAKEYAQAILTVLSVIIVIGLDLSGSMFLIDSLPFAVIANCVYRLL